jgi:hypothetical protein
MNTQEQNTKPARDWRSPLVIGLAVGLAVPFTRDLEKALDPMLGYTGALAVSLVAAAAVGGLVALVLSCLFKVGRRRRG